MRSHPSYTAVAKQINIQLNSPWFKVTQDFRNLVAQIPDYSDRLKDQSLKKNSVLHKLMNDAYQKASELKEELADLLYSKCSISKSARSKRAIAREEPPRSILRTKEHDDATRKIVTWSERVITSAGEELKLATSKESLEHPGTDITLNKTDIECAFILAKLSQPKPRSFRVYWRPVYHNPFMRPINEPFVFNHIWKTWTHIKEYMSFADNPNFVPPAAFKYWYPEHMPPGGQPPFFPEPVYTWQQKVLNPKSTLENTKS